MPVPIALCLEDLDAPPDARYLQCVAIAGTEPGLTLDSRGAACWQQRRNKTLAPDAACELWVSQDERLILFRPEDAVDSVVLTRGGRSLTVPAGKPVVLVDQDQLVVGTRRLRLHIHGKAPAVAAPSLFVPDEPAPESAAGRTARIAATAIAIGAAVGAGGCTKKVEIRDTPPKVAPPQPDAGVKPDTRPAVDVLAPDAAAKKPPPKVEVRVRPPRVARPPKPPKQPLKPLEKPSPKKAK